MTGDQRIYDRMPGLYAPAQESLRLFCYTIFHSVCQFVCPATLSFRLTG